MKLSECSAVLPLIRLEALGESVANGEESVLTVGLILLRAIDVSLYESDLVPNVLHAR